MLDEAHKVGRARKASRLKQPDRRMSFFVKDLRLSRVGAPAVVWVSQTGRSPSLSAATTWGAKFVIMADLNISCMAFYIRLMEQYSIWA